MERKEEREKGASGPRSAILRLRERLYTSFTYSSIGNTVVGGQFLAIKVSSIRYQEFFVLWVEFKFGPEAIDKGCWVGIDAVDEGFAGVE